MKELNEIKRILENLKIKKAKIYFIERKLKDGVSLRAKMLNKYAFFVKGVGSDKAVQELLFKTLYGKICNVLNSKDVVMDEYQVISDDEHNTVYSYKINNKSIPFYDVVNQQLKTRKFETVKSLADIAVSIWAYTMEVEIDDTFLYAFRRVKQTSIVIDKKKGQTPKSFLANLNTTTAQLELASGQNISLDLNIDCLRRVHTPAACGGTKGMYPESNTLPKQPYPDRSAAGLVDCLYWDENIYVFQKKNFEEIIGLDEEFKNKALESIDCLRRVHTPAACGGTKGMYPESNTLPKQPYPDRSAAGLVDLFAANVYFNPLCAEAVRSIVTTTNKHNRKISKLLLEINSLDKERIDQMQKIAPDYGYELKRDKKGKIEIKDENDLSTFLVLLDDALVKSDQTGKKYKASVKKQVNNVK